VAFFDNLTMKNIEQNRCWHVPFMLSEQVLAQLWHPVASSEALNHLYWAMRAISYRCIAMAIEMASKVGVLFDCCFVDCCPGGPWGDTEQGIRCRHPVAYGVALDMPHWAMPSVLLRRTAVAIETAGRKGAFVRHRQFCHRK
jgi:hypothetical protein